MREAIDATPSFRTCTICSPRSWSEKGETNQAESILNTALELYPNYAKAMILLGVLAYQSGKHQQGAGYMVQAVQSEPRYVTPAYLEAMAAHKEGKHEAALAGFQSFRGPMSTTYHSTSESAKSIIARVIIRPPSRRSNKP